MQEGKTYTLTRTVNQSGRQITACRMVRLLEAGETVLVDNGDGTRSRMVREEFEKMVEENGLTREKMLPEPYRPERREE